MWIFRMRAKNREGEVFHNSVKVADAYSGYGVAKNDQSQQDKPGLGPIPAGAYLIGTEHEDVFKHGPVALHLVPQTGTQTFGRSGFLIHGDSKDHPGASSHGCIIVDRKVRETMADGHDKLLLVLPELP